MKDIYLLKIDSNGYSVIKGQVKTETTEIGDYELRVHYLKSPELSREVPACYCVLSND